MGGTPPGDEDLHAFIDGELDAARAAEIAARLESDAPLAARVAAFNADKAMIAQAYGGLDARPLPAEWLEMIGKRRRPKPVRPQRRLATGFAALAASLLLVVVGWLAYRNMVVPQDDPIVAEALSARREAMVPELTLTADALPETAARNQLLTKTLATTLKAPDLGRMGYRLVSVQVYPGGAEGKAVELSYRDAAGRLFTLYLRRPSGPPRVDLTAKGGMRICIWQDDVVGTVMLGEMSAAEMARLASLAYAGLNL